MKEWAEIYKKIVVGIHEMPENLVPEFRPSSFRIAIEITGIEPQPGAGWKYDIETGEFSEPDTVYLTNISRQVFWKRFTAIERENILESNKKSVKKFAKNIEIFESVNLNDPEIIADTNNLEAELIINTGRAAEILTIAEA